MRPIADECCSAVIIKALRDDGHDVISVAERAHGADDETVLRMASEEHRILITEDKDFGHLVAGMKLPTEGLILIRSESSNYTSVSDLLCSYFKKHPDKVHNHFIVATPQRLRVRAI